MLSRDKTIQEVTMSNLVVTQPAPFRQGVPPVIADVFQRVVDTWSQPTAPQVFEQHEVDVFTGMVGDANSIHKPSAFGPALMPGMLSLSSLPRYLGRYAPVDVPEYTTMFQKIVAEFDDFVFVGDPLTLQYFLYAPEPHKLGAVCHCEFRIHVENSEAPSVKGTASLILMETCKFHRMLKFAQRRRNRKLQPK